MSIRTHLIRFAAAFGVVLAAASFAAPAKAASVILGGFPIDGTPTVVGAINTPVPVLLSIELLPDYVPVGGVDGIISVDVNAPMVAFFAFGVPFSDPTPLEVDGSPGVFTYLITTLNQNLDIIVTATLTPNVDGSFQGGPFIRVTTEEVVNAVPIPGALPLFATGLGALGLVHWRRKRRAQVA